MILRFRRPLRTSKRPEAAARPNAKPGFPRADTLKAGEHFARETTPRDFKPELYGYRARSAAEFRRFILAQASPWFGMLGLVLGLASPFVGEGLDELMLLAAEITFVGWALQYPVLLAYAAWTGSAHARVNDEAIARLRSNHAAVEGQRLNRLTKLYAGDADLIERDAEAVLADFGQIFGAAGWRASFEMRDASFLFALQAEARAPTFTVVEHADFARTISTRVFNLSPAVRYVEFTAYDPRHERVYRVRWDREALVSGPKAASPLAEATAA